LRLSVGARYLTAYQSFERTGDGFFNGGPTSDAASAHDHAATPRLSVNYEINDETSFYTTMSKGFRLGAPNPLVPTQFCAGDLANLGLTAAPSAYSHEDLWNYEAGVKSQPARWAAINASGFYIKWDKLQQSFNLPTCGFAFSTNVGSARSYGAELELTMRPTPELTLSGTTGYTNATLTEPVASIGIERGTPVEGVPRWNASAAAEWKRPLAADLSGFVRGNYNYTGASHGALLTSDPDYLRPSYDLVGASFGVALHDWEFGVYATNLLDEHKIIQTPDHADLPVGYTLRPRTVGISASGKF
jgi:outer membrane receptor protein involved in Fe transport